MSDTRKLREALASILHSGLISMRGMACRDSLYIEAESNHLHNLPFCIARMRDDDIEHYDQTERPRYMAALRLLGGHAKAQAPNYRDHWAVVRSHLRKPASEAPDCTPGVHFGSSSHPRADVTLKRSSRCTTTAGR